MCFLRSLKRETDKNKSRVVARYSGNAPGPLLIVIGSIHGNEKSGVKALRLLKKMLDVEPVTNPNFRYNGNLVGLIGNMEAYRKNQRFIDRDLNRLWTTDNMAQAKKLTPESNAIHEYQELLSLHGSIVDEVKRYKPTELIILDLHTTSSDGGIFVIPSFTERSRTIARQLHAPVINDILRGIEGTTLHYFNDLTIEGAVVTALTFEAGQHIDPLSVNRCIAAIVSCMRAINAVDAADVENIHDQTLIDYSAALPDSCRFLYKHEIETGDQFEMKAGYKNFQAITEGELLAQDINGPIYAQRTGRILMPLYQTKGEDGFFVIEDI